MWREYRIPANYEKQKEIIRKLRKWILGLEEPRKLIRGFAFDYYSNLHNEPDTLRLRFDYENTNNQEKVKKELIFEVKQILPEYSLQEQNWDSEKGILEAYEFGSRCAFLFFWI